jgi:prevent-host-death family protein
MYMLMYIDDMALKYSVAAARSSLPALIDQAEAGRTIELTRRGQPVAVVVSIRQFERLRGARPRFGDAYRHFLETHSLEEIGVDRDFAASSREKGVGRKVSL